MPLSRNICVLAVSAPPGCFVNPQHPAAVAARGLGGFRIAQAVFGALAKALPERVPAAWGGGEFGVSFGGYYPDGRAFVFLEFNNDGPRGGGLAGHTGHLRSGFTPLALFPVGIPRPEPGPADARDGSLI